MKKILVAGLGIGLLVSVSACSSQPSMTEADVAFVKRMNDLGVTNPEETQAALAIGQQVCEGMREADDPKVVMGNFKTILSGQDLSPAHRTFIMHSTFQNLCTEFQPIAGEWQDKRLPTGW